MAMQLQNNHYFVYILGGTPRSDLQIGIAGDINAHRQKVMSAASETDSNDSAYKLVYYEHYDMEEIARNRERQIKEGPMDAAYQLIESMNPNWLDLSDMLQD